jgi:hypothetical protein
VVVAVHMGYVDTDATRGIHAPKVSAAKVAEKTMDAITRNDPEVLVDQTAQRVRFLPSGPPDLLYPAPSAARDGRGQFAVLGPA